MSKKETKQELLEEVIEENIVEPTEPVEEGSNGDHEDPAPNRRADLKEGHKYRMEIVDYSSEGWGIGRMGTLAVFLKEGLPVAIGDDVVAKITTLKKNLAYGKTTKIRRVSPKRRKSQCKYSLECGGCSLQHIRYPSQLAYKREAIENSIFYLGKVKKPKVFPVKGMKNPTRYRNKVMFPVGSNGTVGLYKPQSHEVIECKTCMIVPEAAEKVADVMREYIKSGKITPYHWDEGTGLLRHVGVRMGMVTGEVMVILVINDERIPQLPGLVDALEESLAKLKPFTVNMEDEEVEVSWQLKSIVINFNQVKSSVIMGEHSITAYGEDRIMDVTDDGLLFEISANSFFQVNTHQMKALYDTAIEYAELTGSENVIDAYCGVGSIGIHLAKKANKVVGIEFVEDAIDDAWRNAQLNGISNIEFICGRAEDEMQRLIDKGEIFDVAILDPPTKGCDIRLLQSIADARPKRIVYVSCNPATLARDIARLNDLGYQFVKAQPVDMFPQTASMECVALLEPKSRTKQAAMKEEDMAQSPATAALMDLMMQKGITPKSLSIKTGVTLKRVNDILNGERQINEAYARVLGEVFGKDAPFHYWIALLRN